MDLRREELEEMLREDGGESEGRGDAEIEEYRESYKISELD